MFYFTDFTLQLNSFQSLIRDLQSSVTYDNAPVLEFLPHVNALLERAVSVCRAAMNMETIDAGAQPLMKKENLAPGEMKELQWRFRATAKTPGRKRSGLVLRCEYNSYG